MMVLFLGKNYVDSFPVGHFVVDQNFYKKHRETRSLPSRIIKDFTLSVE